MAAHATGGRSLVFAANVATRAVEGGVRPGEREARHLEMIKACSQPGRNRVTLFARGRKAGRDVVGSRGLLVARRMARVALERESLEPADSGILVATVAL